LLFFLFSFPTRRSSDLVVYIVCLFLESILSCFFPFRIPLCLLAVLWGVKKGDYVFPIVTGFLYDFSYTGFYFLTSAIYLVLYVSSEEHTSELQSRFDIV